MGLHLNLYWAHLEPMIRARCNMLGQFHGSIVRDCFIEWASGRFCVDDHAEKLLAELVEEGVIQTLQRAPTPSQAAFAGLSYSAKGYRQMGWGPGTIEHYWYELSHSLRW